MTGSSRPAPGAPDALAEPVLPGRGMTLDFDPTHRSSDGP